VCEADSDGDGRTNGEELGDPKCHVFCICVLYMCVRVSTLSLFLQLYDTILKLSDICILSLLQHRFVSTIYIDVKIDICNSNVHDYGGSLKVTFTDCICRCTSNVHGYDVS
jgi:hypothetical protein